MRWVHDSHNISNTQRWPQVLGYQVWVYATYIALPLIYIWIRCYVRVKVNINFIGFIFTCVSRTTSGLQMILGHVFGSCYL